MSPEISFVIPIYNEASNIEKLVSELKGLLGKLSQSAEVIFVDDGSSDSSFQLLEKYCGEQFKVLQLSRNFGHQVAISAGMDYASGAAIVIMDADLQDPPSVVLEMIQKWKEGYEVVYGVRIARDGDSFFKRATAALFYRLLNRLSKVKIPPDVGDFRLVDRKALEVFKKMREHNRYVRGMFSWVGFRQIGVPYKRDERYSGHTKYPLRKMLKLAVDGVVSFSNVPLRWVLSLGFLVSLVSFTAGMVAIYLKVTGSYVVTGWTSLVVVISFIGGIQLMVLGAIGEYIGRIYEEVQNRPLYIVFRQKGF